MESNLVCRCHKDIKGSKEQCAIHGNPIVQPVQKEPVKSYVIRYTELRTKAVDWANLLPPLQRKEFLKHMGISA